MNAKSNLLEEFLLESDENLSSLDQELTSFESNQNRELLNQIYRKVHTLKGSAGFLGFKELQKITHAAENVLDLIREDKIPLTESLTDALLNVFDVSRQILHSIRLEGSESEGLPDGTISKIFSALEDLTANPSNTLLTDELYHVSNTQSTHSLKLIKRSDKPSQSEEMKQNCLESPPQPVETKVQPLENHKPEPPPKVTDKGPPSPVTAKKDFDPSESVVRVPVTRLDKIMNTVGELVLTRNQILQNSQATQSSSLQKLIHELNIITSELQNEIMYTRMQPIGNVLTKFERMTRDLSKQQRKKVKLEIEGKNTELDKTLLEAIKDPLTHIIRNCIDHGIETPEARLEKGKSEQATILVRSYHEGGQVAIEIKDDGAGIDRDRVLEKAIDKGLVKPADAPSLGPQQVLNLIFEPGFSTAKEVTNLSGRGVGMDVVRTNIEKIGGSALIESVVDQGTTLKLKIPLTLAIVPALVLKCRNEYFALPQVNLVELVKVDPEKDSYVLEKVKNSEFLRLRDEIIPILRLSDILGLTDSTKHDGDDLDDSHNVIVLNSDGVTYGLIVDEILDTEEIVVKPLDSAFKQLDIFAGATIMGDGRVALILDAVGILKMMDYESNKRQETKENFQEQDKKLETQEILMIQLADNRPYGIPLVFVNRLEEFKFSQVEFSGSQPLIRYRDTSMPLINVEDLLDIEAQSVLKKSQEESSDVRFSTIVIQSSHYLLGFVVKSIQDIAITRNQIDTRTISQKGVLGTIYIENKTVTVLDIPSLSQSINFLSHKKNSEKLIEKSLNAVVVDDSSLFRVMVEKLLIQLGMNVSTFCNGQEAFEHLQKENNIDLLISDIEMPQMDGYQLIEKVRGLTHLKDMKAIALTTKASEKDRKRGQTLGFDYYLKKMDPDEVLETVNCCFSNKGTGNE